MDIIQVYSARYRFAKPDYPAGRQQLLDRAATLKATTTGQLRAGTLYLASGTPPPDLTKVGLMVLLDDVAIEVPGAQIPLQQPSPLYFHKPLRQGAVELFQIEKTGPATFDISLHYSAHAALIGLPRRQDHRIAVLRAGEPVCYRINGKADFSLSGRRQRTYTEYHYLFEYLGQARQVEFRPLNKLEASTCLPTAHTVVDERKMLF